jgi:hypothetical protein
MASSASVRRSSGAESLKDPATYLHAALRAFVSSTHECVDSLLRAPEVFNYGAGARYPDVSAIWTELEKAIDYWKPRNAFVTDLLRATLNTSNSKHSIETPADVVISDVFLPLTNYFFSYIKVDRRHKPVATVRVLFPVDSECGECPLGPAGSQLCANSCFRFSFFPYKPPGMLDVKYNGHFRTAQFALADASFAAATPDLNLGSMTEISLAALMVPLLLGQPLLFTDASAAKEQYDVPFNARVLQVQWRFPRMNHDLGIRSEAFIPIKVPRPFMPGFYSGRSTERQFDKTQMWVPDFPNSCPFCIEFYSPMPDWFAHADNDNVRETPNGQRYVFQDSTGNNSLKVHNPPIPNIATLGDRAGENGTKSLWEDIAKVLALGFNLQHYSELMACAFVDWLRYMFTEKTSDPLEPALKRRYIEKLGLSSSKALHPEVQKFFKFVSDTPDLLADVLNEIHHGMLLQLSFARTMHFELSSLEGIRELAKSVDAAAHVEALPYGSNRTPYCEAPFDLSELSRVLALSDESSVLPRLVAEIIRNYKRQKQDDAIQYHACFDPDQKRFSLHFRSPGVNVDLRTYLDLRQGLPAIRETTLQDDGGTHKGIGLALSRVIAEDAGFDYVLGLGRDDGALPDEICLPATPTFDVEEYRKHLYTRIYFGGAQ